MSERFEYNDSADDQQRNVSADERIGQSFTPQLAHKITSFKFKAYRLGDAQGNLVYAIYLADGAHKPTGDILCSGSKSPSDMTTSPPGALYEITLGAGSDLANGVVYVCVLSYVDGDGTHYIRPRFDAATSGYTRGRFMYSTNAGVDWTVAPEPGADAVFEEWGELPEAAGGGSAPLAAALSDLGIL